MKTNGNDLITEELPNGYGFDTIQKLTKREYFAAMAMQGFCSNSAVYGPQEEYASLSIKMADALIEALNKD